MSLETTLSVNFGSRKKNLSTVGYTLYNQGKTVLQSRTTTGVTQILSGTGLYQLFASLPEAFIGSIVWDTGEDTPLYAIEDLDFRKFTFQSVMVGGQGKVKNIWTEKEKKRILKNVKAVLDIVKNMKIVDNSELLKVIGANIKEANERGILNYKFMNESLALISVEVKKGDTIKTLQEGIELLSKGMVAMIEDKETTDAVKEVNEYVEAQAT